VSLPLSFVVLSWSAEACSSCLAWFSFSPSSNALPTSHEFARRTQGFRLPTLPVTYFFFQCFLLPVESVCEFACVCLFVCVCLMSVETEGRGRNNTNTRSILSIVLYNYNYWPFACDVKRTAYSCSIATLRDLRFRF